MVKEITIPDIGENVKSGQVVGLLVSVGDVVEKDDGIIEYETEKAVVEIPSPHAGKITEILVKEGDEIDVGATIARIDTEASKEEEPEEEAAEEVEQEGAEETQEEPDEEPDEEPEEEPGEAEEKPDEAEEEEPARQKKASAKEKARPVSSARAATGPPRKPRPVQKGKETGEPLPASPSVRRLARELGVELSEVTGSGPGGRISLDDVKTHVREVVSTKPGAGGGRQSTAPSGARVGAKPLPDFEKWGEIESESFSRVRKTIADGTAYSWPTIPRVTQFDEADVTDLEQFVKRHKDDASDRGGKLTITAVLLKACAAALKTFPKFNASIDIENEQIIYKKYYHLGVAADTDRGLLVPVVRDVDKKGLYEIAVEMNQVVGKARDKKISPDEMEGGTFTISNQGSIGGTNFTPLVYWPQVAILGVSRTVTKPRWIDNEWRPRRILPLSVSYDHRLIDGADAARFLGWLVEALQQPMLMQLD